MREASERAPIQAAALLWLQRRTANGHPHSRAFGSRGRWLLRLRDLYLHTGANSTTVAALERKGLVELSHRPVYRKPVPSITSTREDEPPPLTTAQAAAWRGIASALRVVLASVPTDDRRLTIDDRQILSPQSSALSTFLLHGVTGSGKTEVYLRAIGMALRMGRQAIVLVPEISLTPQAVHRFASRFPGRVALIHSQLSAGQQFDEWRRIREGHADIVVGSRSAVFAPLPRLGLIVVDEEHEWAYKQGDFPPRYHARDVALKRAALTGSAIILGSATPDLATYHRAQQGEYRLLSLPTRVGRRTSRGGSHLITELPMHPCRWSTCGPSCVAATLPCSVVLSRAPSIPPWHEVSRLYFSSTGEAAIASSCAGRVGTSLCAAAATCLSLPADVYGMLCHRCNAYSLAPRECPRCGSDQ